MLDSSLAVEIHVQVSLKKKEGKIRTVPNLCEYPVGALAAGNLEKQLESLE